MNDRFKFRVWDNNKKEYLDKGYIHRKGYLVMPTMKNDYSLAEAEGDFIIEQCTGLRYKNGKLIYEGDILKDIYGVIKIVYWNEEYSSLRVKYKDNTHCGFLWQQYVDVYEMEVIGNIHENQEILKEEE